MLFMKEIEYPQIEFINQPINKRDYCVVPSDENVRNILIGILDLERQLTEDNLGEVQLGRLVMRHIVLWNELPDYYKSELADLTSITNFE
jgi:hypothetical protein